MICKRALLFSLVLLSQVRTAVAKSDADDPEALWSNAMGTSQNTHRIVPSMAIHASKRPWIYEYNLTSQDATVFGQGAGINGDLYFFLSETRMHSADFMACLTVNGTIRWKLPLELVADMLPMGVSNIVSDRQGHLFYIVPWAGNGRYTAKVCRVTDAQTAHPVQKCLVNAQLYFNFRTPLAIVEKYDLLVTAVSANGFESVPAVLSKSSLALLWLNRQVFGAGSRGDYRWDSNTGDLLWIGGNDHLLKFKYTGETLLDNLTQLGGFGTDFVLDGRKQVIVRPWQNSSSLPWKLLVSSHDVSTGKVKLRWHWRAPPAIAENEEITVPSIDSNGTTYLSSMPLAFAIDSAGKTVWTSELATASEMREFELVSTCTAMNSKRRILYIVSGSYYARKSNCLYFMTAVHMDTGRIIKRIDLNVGNEAITPNCPVLIGDEMFYFSWLTGEYPQSVPFKVTGIAQL